MAFCLVKPFAEAGLDRRIIAFARKHWPVLLIVAIALVSMGKVYADVYGVDGYISDEIYYVSAARNMVHIFLHSTTWRGGEAYVTVYAPGYADALAEAFCAAGAEEVALLGSPPDQVQVKTGHPEQFVWVAERIGATWRVSSYPYPNASAMVVHYNWEHPPLAKYIIALALLVHDSPASWRLTSVAAGVVTIVALGLAAWRLTRNRYAGVLAAALIGFSPSALPAFGVAFLEPYTAMFLALSVYMFASGRPRLGAVMFGLAVMSKEYAVLAFPLLLAPLPRFRVSRRWLLEAFDTFITMATYAMVPLLLYLPSIIYLGFDQWMNQSVAGALGWHLSPKGGHPEASAWFEWLVAPHPFPMYLSPELTVKAYVDPLLIAVFLLPVLALLAPGAWWFGAASLSYYMGFALIYLLGSTTQFTFYTFGGLYQMACTEAAMTAMAALSLLIQRSTSPRTPRGRGSSPPAPPARRPPRRREARRKPRLRPRRSKSSRPRTSPRRRGRGSP